MNFQQAKKILNRLLCLLFLSVSLWADAPFIFGERERYYEGDPVMVSINFTAKTNAQVTCVWSVLGKELKRESMTMGYSPKMQASFHTRAPEGLRAVTPLTVDISIQSADTLVAKSSRTAQIFPRTPSYFLGNDDRIPGILVFDPKERVQTELRDLGLGYTPNDYPGNGAIGLMIVGARVFDSEDGEKWMQRYTSIASKHKIPIIFFEQSTLARGLPFKIKENVVPISVEGCPGMENLLPAEIQKPLRWGFLQGCLSSGFIQLATGSDVPPILWSAPLEKNSQEALAVETDYHGVRVIMSQVSLTGYLDEPLARWWLVQLIRKALQE